MVGSGRPPEQLDGLALGRRREGVEAHVRRQLAGGHLLQQQVLGGDLDAFLGLLGRERGAELSGRGAAHRRVGLVHDHGEAAVLEAGLAANLLQQEREGLQRDDDDRLAVGQRLGELPGLRSVLAGDAGDHAVLVLELVDRVLQLRVEHRAVGDDDHRVEDLGVLGVVQRRELVGQPRDRVGLAGAGRVLDEVGVAGALHPRRGDELGHRLPLVEAGEDQPFLGRLLAVLGDLLHPFEVNEAAEDVQPRVALQHPFPEVRRAVAEFVRRVAGCAVVAEVERQEAGRAAGQLGRHVDLIGADREVNQRPALEGEQRLGLLGRRVLRRPVLAVLGDGVLHRLGEVGLQLGGGDRDAVDEEHEVDAALVMQRVVDLPHHPQAHLGVAGGDLRVVPVGRLELAQLEAGADRLHRMAEDGNGAVGVHDAADALQQQLLGAAVVPVLELGPLRRLRLLEVPDQVLGEERQLAVVALVVRRVEPAVGRRGTPPARPRSAFLGAASAWMRRSGRQFFDVWTKCLL